MEYPATPDLHRARRAGAIPRERKMLQDHAGGAPLPNASRRAFPFIEKRFAGIDHGLTATPVPFLQPGPRCLSAARR